MPVIAIAGLAVAVAGTVTAVMAAKQQADNQQKAANYNAQENANDAQVATWQRQQQEQQYSAQALVTQQEGAQDASRLEMQNGALVAHNIAAAASSGVAISGSTEDAITGSAANNELAVLNEEHKTQLDAWQNQIGAANASYNSVIQANRYDAQSGLFSMEGANAQTTGMFNEVGAGVSGASKVFTAANSANDEGLFD